MMRYGQTIRKVECPYCPMYVYPGNLERHTRACLRRQTAKRERERRELRKLPFTGRMRIIMAGGPYDGREYVIEPIGEVDNGGFHGRCLRARFYDPQRGYWDEGDFRLDQIAAMMPELELTK